MVAIKTSAILSVLVASMVSAMPAIVERAPQAAQQQTELQCSRGIESTEVFQDTAFIGIQREAKAVDESRECLVRFTFPSQTGSTIDAEFLPSLSRAQPGARGPIKRLDILNNPDALTQTVKLETCRDIVLITEIEAQGRASVLNASVTIQQCKE